MDRTKIVVPVMEPYMAPPEREFPITPRENLLRAFDHKKPVWMPVVQHAVQWIFPGAYRDMPPGGPNGQTGEHEDWFGTKYSYSPLQGGCTPMGGVFDEIGEWRDKMKFPDPDKVDWGAEAPLLVRTPGTALATRMGSGIFERLHMCEGFEQCLVDIITEPEECRAFFDRVGEYKIDSFRHLNDVYHFDFICYHDDWSNARAQFFSCDIFEQTLLESAVKMAEAVHAAGCRYMAHCCGKMEVWVPYFADVIHADMLEIQPINDIRWILDNFGGKVTPMLTADPYILYDPDTTAEQARAYAREVVDKYGAHTCEGSGAAVSLVGSNPESYYAFEDELYHYSLEKYRDL